MLSFKAKDENSNEYKKAKEEFTYLLENEKFKHSGYAGLIQLYNISNKSEKIKEIILEISEEPKLAEKTLYYTMRFKPETAIALLKNWKEIYPGDTERIDILIRQIKTRNKEGF